MKNKWILYLIGYILIMTFIFIFLISEKAYVRFDKVFGSSGSSIIGITTGIFFLWSAYRDSKLGKVSFKAVEFRYTKSPYWFLLFVSFEIVLGLFLTIYSLLNLI
jgi:hypothetical protein